ncbi:hypothetical protein QYM36_010632, partial [Artemia franciscana]
GVDQLLRRQQLDQQLSQCIVFWGQLSAFQTQQNVCYEAKQNMAVSYCTNNNILIVASATGTAAVKPVPKWDLKGRLQNLEAKFNDTENNNRTLEERVKHLESVKDCLESDNTQKVRQYENVQKELDETHGKLKEALMERESIKTTLNNKIGDLEFQLTQKNRMLNSLQQDYDAATQEVAALKRTNSELASAHSMSEAKIASLKAMLDSKDIMLDSKDTLIEDLQTAKMKLEQKNADFVERLRAGEKLRRKLHGQMQDMKGNIRVFCRVRPIIPSDNSKTDDMPHIKLEDGNKIVIFTRPELMFFLWKKVFRLYFKHFCRPRFEGWSYKLEATFIEIYNETIRDLLGNTGATPEIRMVASNSKEVYISNTQKHEVKSVSEVYRLLSMAQKQRAVASTACNERSSRSHSIFQLKIVGDNSATSEKTQGILSLVDLAGSERLKESLSSGDRLVETQNINKSLAQLGNVIAAVAGKKEHIPYRDSKLTHALMNSLGGGNSKTLMFVNISPLEKNGNESLNSLNFAAKVHNCHIGVATSKKTKV